MREPSCAYLYTHTHIFLLSFLSFFASFYFYFHYISIHFFFILKTLHIFLTLLTSRKLEDRKFHMIFLRNLIYYFINKWIVRLSLCFQMLELGNFNWGEECYFRLNSFSSRRFTNFYKNHAVEKRKKKKKRKRFDNKLHTFALPSFLQFVV